MMVLPGLLIEYLIAGGLALPWLWPTLRLLDLAPESIPLPVLGIVLYVIGMVLDFVAFTLLTPAKRWLRRRMTIRLGRPAPTGRAVTATRQVKLFLHAPELAREVGRRSSRDRIARSTALNCLMAVIVWRGTVPWPIGILLTLLCLVMWAFFERNSYTFELRAEEAVDALLTAGGSSTRAAV